MIRINPSSIEDLVALKESGAPVTLTSHPGNASLYKLSLWHAGIPEHLWDVTCCVADANNWPMYRLEGGEAKLLLAEKLFGRIRQETNGRRRFVTAYQKTADGVRLARVHVRTMEACFPNAISSCSRLILAHRERFEDVFAYLAETRPHDVFGRFITPDGVLVPAEEAGLSTHDLPRSFMTVVRELDQLVFSDEPMETRGGACYEGVMVPLSTMLAQYWQSGQTTRYDISGPDMIHYATRPSHQAKLTEMLAHLRHAFPKLIPDGITVRMFPGTVARVGHIEGHASEAVMKRKRDILENPPSEKDVKRALWETAKDDERSWPTEIRPREDRYFSQHDLLPHTERFSVDAFWKRIPLDRLKDALTQANALLHLR